MKKRFGIDIDGTVTCPSSLIPFINDAFKLNLTLADVKQYELTPLVNVPEQEFAEWFTKTEPAIYNGSPLAEGAKDVLFDWAREHELYFISARGNHLLDITEKWFKKHEIPFHHIELIGTHHKIEAAKDHKVDIFLEDKHDNAVMISEQCQIPVLLFDTPYNQDPIPSSVIRVNNWLEAATWVKKWLEDDKEVRS
ncbi:hypothetical protein ACFSO7_19150 [Bacillus sp. CGMCC 1.16607]|uniref:hypothetical protein n=1 Tax=Bacillus sp. CGMCC 1.16607 TaxID=3351842 RepID=UPI003626CD24